MTLTQLEYALAVAKHLNFGKAAAACHVSQPSLSVQIRKLEDELDVRLFERTKTKCELTEIGREILAQARVVLDETRRVTDVAGAHRTEIRGTLRLGVIPTIAPYLLPHVLPRLRQQHRRLRIELFEQKTGDLVTLVDDGAVDAAILSTPRIAPATLREQVLYYEPFLLLAAKGHPLRRVEPLTLDAAKGYAALLLDDTHCMRDQVEALCGARAAADGDVTMRSGTLQTLVEIVSSSGGFTLLPALAESAFRRTHREALRAFVGPQPSRKVSLVYHRSFLKRPLIEAIVALIRAELPPGLLPVERRREARVVDPRADRFA